jgi:hypothetical protein
VRGHECGRRVPDEGLHRATAQAGHSWGRGLWTYPRTVDLCPECFERAGAPGRLPALVALGGVVGAWILAPAARAVRALGGSSGGRGMKKAKKVCYGVCTVSYDRGEDGTWQATRRWRDGRAWVSGPVAVGPFDRPGAALRFAQAGAARLSASAFVYAEGDPYIGKESP